MAVRPLASQSAQVRSPAILADRLVNMYAEVSPSSVGGSPRGMLGLYGTPGLSLFATSGANGPTRAVFTMGGYAYMVVGSAVYRVSTGGTATVCTGTVSGSGPVFGAENGTQLVIVIPPLAWVASGTSVAQITDPDFPGASSVTYMDGYMVFTEPDSGRFFISDINDATQYDALDFASAEGAPDPLVRAFNDHRELWLFGVESTEIWANTGAADFPFQRVDGAFIERGCAAANSVAKADNTVYWLGDDRIVYMANGYVPQRVSTYGIENEIRQFSTISDAIGWSYAQAGHTYYVIKFPTANRTFVYDVSTTLWHERQSGPLIDNAWRINSGVEFAGKIVCADNQSGNLYWLDLDTYTEAGDAIRSVMQTPPVFGDMNERITIPAFEIVIEAGVGELSGQGVDPQIALTWSDDNGATWFPEKWRSMGARGQRQTRLEWKRLGSTRYRIFRAVITDPVKRAIVGFAPVAERFAA